MTLNKLPASLARIVVLIACLGLIVWMWRQSERSRRPPTVHTWVDRLQAGDPDVRKNAVQELSSAAAADAGTVVPALIGAVRDRDVTVRTDAVLALARYLETAVKARQSEVADQCRAAASGLLEVVKTDADTSVTGTAAFALASLHRALADAGIKPDPARAPDPIDPRTIAHAFNTVLERDPATRLAVLVPYQSLGAIGEPAPAALLAALDDPSSAVRKEVLQVLCQFTSGSDQAVPVLLKDAAVKPPPSGIMATKFAAPGSPLQKAAAGLHPTAAVVPILAKAIESQNLDVRRAAVVLLSRVGPDARATAPALVAATEELIRTEGGKSSREGPQFSDYADAVAQILPADEAVALLGTALGRDHRAIRTAAATALGKLGPRGQAAVPVLLGALKETAGATGGGRADSSYTGALVQSLGQIAPVASLAKPAEDEVIDVLSHYLESSPTFLRISAARGLGSFGARAAGALAKLRALADSEQAPAAAREAATAAIEKIEPQKKAEGA